MVPRAVQPHLAALFERYPVVTLTGPRQSGKTTLCRATFPDLPYVNLERPDLRALAVDDPLGLLRRYRDGAIFDEIQRAPELTSYLQAHVDEAGRNGLFVLTGSQQLHLDHAVSQSLAGRTGLIRLLPFSIAEASQVRPGLEIDEWLYTGFYPRIYDQGIEPTQALGDYFGTYVQRDVRQLSEIRNLSGFETFVRLCAGRVGQLLNLSRLGASAGVSHTTAREWLSVLEASVICFRLEPHHPRNVTKRLTKSPKLYFYDVGLAAYLLGIEHPRQIFSHPLRGELFENLIVVEALKSRLHRGKRSNLAFYRDAAKLEIDLVLELAHRVVTVEIKSGATLSRSFFQNFAPLREVLGADAIAGEILVYGGEAPLERHGVKVVEASGLAAAIEEIEAKEAASGIAVSYKPDWR